MLAICILVFQRHNFFRRPVVRDATPGDDSEVIIRFADELTAGRIETRLVGGILFITQPANPHL